MDLMLDWKLICSVGCRHRSEGLHLPARPARPSQPGLWAKTVPVLMPTVEAREGGEDVQHEGEGKLLSRSAVEPRAAGEGDEVQQEGWSAALPPDCIGQLIGVRGHNIQRLQRQLKLIKLTVVKKDGSDYLRIEAATQARLSSAQHALIDEVARYLRLASSTRKRKRE